MAERRRFYEALHQNLSDDQLDRMAQRLIMQALGGTIFAFRALADTLASPLRAMKSTPRSPLIESL